MNYRGRHSDGTTRPLKRSEWLYLAITLSPLLLGAVAVFVAILAGRVAA